ncbi:MAG: peptidoglycan recognition family protein [Candidatus Paceibacterota bacterium]|jgi:hypothetical protein
MARCELAAWRPLPENATQQRITPTQVILHSAVDAPGPTSLFGYFARADIGLESHFFVKLDGSIEQYMDTKVQADANRWANVRAISIETEDEGNPNQRPWTDAQVRSLVALLQWANQRHGIPLKRCSTWISPGVGYHSMFGAPGPWTPAAGKTCPGHARIAQFNGLLDLATTVVQPPTTPTPDEEDNVATIYWLKGTSIANHAYIVSGISAHYLDLPDLLRWRSWGAKEVKEPVPPSQFAVLDGPLRNVA